MMNKLFVAASLLFVNSALALESSGLRDSIEDQLNAAAEHAKRLYLPQPATGVKIIHTPTNVTIRYKEPGKDGVCETTPGVRSYSGYIDLAPNVHTFFWFFESRSNPAKDPLTLWLNGGPGSDSLLGLFQEMGPCRINEDLTSVLNPYSWTNVSNVLFLSQPVGVGFSYQEEAIGSLSEWTGSFLNASQAAPTGRYPILDPVDVGSIDTTELAAMATWHILQGFLSGLPSLDAKLGHDHKHNKKFNLWTESYGGHYGPSFYKYFYDQNKLILNGTQQGFGLDFDTLGIASGLIDEKIQVQSFPEYAVNNTYGIKLYNDTVYGHVLFNLNRPLGCLDQIDLCTYAAQSIEGGYVNGRITQAALSTPSVKISCAEAMNMCRDNVENIYLYFSDRGVYDIRHPRHDATPPKHFQQYLNQAHIQNSLGVDLNYTSTNNDIVYAFQASGDFVYTNFLADLEDVLSYGVRVSLLYGDADYIINWFGGEAVSLAANWTHQAEFAAAGYQPLMVNGAEYGEVREYGNFSFTRVYEAGHEVPYYQPQAALAIFNRSISHFAITDGVQKITANLSSHGSPHATHTNSPVALPPTGAANYASWSSSVVAYYSSLDNAIPSAKPQ